MVRSRLRLSSVYTQQPDREHANPAVMGNPVVYF